jgi:hypothetical protein
METALAESLPRVKSVASGKGFSLNVEWSNGARSRVDLTGLVHSSRHFVVFASDAAAFRRLKPDEFGTGIEWANGLDLSSATLKTLADEQKPLSGAYLRRFEADRGLNTHETARLFDVTDRTIQTLRKASELPAQFSIALRRFDTDPTVFAAHYKPVAVRPRGRPKSTASAKHAPH